MKTNRSLHSSINVGVLGLGTVGSAVVRNLARVPGIKVKMGCDLRKVETACVLTRDPMALINDPAIDVVVETIGGINPAKQLVLAALKAGKHVVTSNKQLVALHLEELMAAADKSGVSFLFEGAVGGGIPILNTLRDELSGNIIEEVYGIVNGTTNYILSEMTEKGEEFAAVLKEAQRLGYAEANPKADVEGYDASYKAAILAAVAFRAKVKWSDVYREGIEKITAEDIDYAYDAGYAIKLLAVARKVEGELDIRVHPALVPFSHPLANVSANNNAIYVRGVPVGELMFYGPGAGGDPTSSAVINDILTLGNDECRMTNDELRSYPIRKIDQIESRYYIRLQAPDKHGVLAGISRAFADHQVSIAGVTQLETRGNTATIVILVHKVKEANLTAALKKVGKLPVVKKIGNVIRII
ncbi:MAG: homoserine dehydrogenase [Candidatus Margulisbacteria bacterium]|jgi:homoserine dehydrogenase|nr:homoserine dehydrogenase [Candidatus Margulisiibacteriota bacterium]